jgi:hypothetical protein
MAAVSLARTVPVRAVRKARFGALSAAPFGSLLLLACMWLNLNTELPLGAEPR